MQTPPFFIIGVGRSGTTLLRQMMDSHPDIAIPYETHFITHYIDKLPDYGDLHEPSNIKRLIKDLISEEMIQKWNHSFHVDDIYASLSENSLSAIIDSLYTSYAASNGKSRWGDKSDYLNRMHKINKLFPDAKFIHIIRDGRDVCNSVIKLPWGPRNIIEGAEWWNEHVKLGRAMGAMLDESRYTEVRFEDLVASPQTELSRLCRFIRADYSDAMLEYYKNSDSTIPDDRKYQHHNANVAPTTARTYAWKKEMSELNVALFDHYARETLADLDYENYQGNISKLKTNFAKLFILLRQQLKR